MGCADIVAGLYGIRRILADIDANQRHSESGAGGVIAGVLNWIMGPGFEEFFERYERWPFREAVEYRQRHIIRALKGRMLP